MFYHYAKVCKCTYEWPEGTAGAKVKETSTVKMNQVTRVWRRECCVHSLLAEWRESCSSL